MRGQQLDAFFEITARWHLTHAEQRALLGSPTDERWNHFMHNTVPDVPSEEFARVYAVIQIDAALWASFSDPSERTHWLRTLEMAPPFFGRTPLALLFRGIEGFKAVAEYLATRSRATRPSTVR